MSNSSIKPFVGTAGGALAATALTGGNAIGVAATGGILGTFGLPFIGALIPLAATGWLVGQIWEAVTEPPAPRKIVDVTPVTVEATQEPEVLAEPIRCMAASSMQTDTLAPIKQEKTPQQLKAAKSLELPNGYFTESRVDRYLRTGKLMSLAELNAM